MLEDPRTHNAISTRDRAPGRFESPGYRAIVRDRVPAGVPRTAEFRSRCPASAVCLHKSP
jgi:hypothetical protein